MHSCIQSFVHSCLSASVHLCLHLCIRAFVHACHSIPFQFQSVQIVVSFFIPSSIPCFSSISPLVLQIHSFAIISFELNLSRAGRMHSCHVISCRRIIHASINHASTVHHLSMHPSFHHAVCLHARKSYKIHGLLASSFCLFHVQHCKHGGTKCTGDMESNKKFVKEETPRCIHCLQVKQSEL